MNVINYSELRLKLKDVLDSTIEDNETTIISRGKNEGAVIISLSEYNAMKETMHLLSTKTNANRLFEAIERAKKNEYILETLREN